MSKELKRMQKLAGLNEIRVNPPGTYNAVFQDWVEGQINMLLQYPEDYQRELEYIKPFKKVSVSSLEELAQTIKEIDDHITEQSDESSGAFYYEVVREPIRKICDEINFGQKDELISLLDKLYNEDEF
jgi:RNA processing factor Prp31